MKPYSTPPQLTGMYQKAIEGKLSPRQAIRLQCYHCMGWNIAEAKRCQTRVCPLWQYSPAAKISQPARQEREKHAGLTNEAQGHIMDANK